jgi:hypothetical protein
LGKLKRKIEVSMFWGILDLIFIISAVWMIRVVDEGQGHLGQLF